MATINDINANQLLDSASSPTFAWLTIDTLSGITKVTSWALWSATPWTDYEAALWFTPENVANKSTDIVTDAASDTKYPSAKAVKTYADWLVVWLLDYRGAYDASGNAYPTTWGSGTAWAVLKWDAWVISVAGTLWWVAIQAWDTIVANVDTPWQTSTNWNTLNVNIWYVPEDVANKVTSISWSSTNTEYLSAKLTYDQLALKAPAWSVITWNEVTWTTQTITVNNWYITNNASLITLTLPTTAAVWDWFRIGWKWVGGWLIAQNALQSMKLWTSSTTIWTSWNLASTNTFDSVDIVCTVADTTFVVLSSVGNIVIDLDVPTITNLSTLNYNAEWENYPLHVTFSDPLWWTPNNISITANLWWVINNISPWNAYWVNTFEFTSPINPGPSILEVIITYSVTNAALVTTTVHQSAFVAVRIPSEPTNLSFTWNVLNWDSMPAAAYYKVDNVTQNLFDVCASSSSNSCDLTWLAMSWDSIDVYAFNVNDQSSMASNIQFP